MSDIIAPLMNVYTIGHSNLASDVFLNLLETNAIEVLVDVRSNPFSRFSPHFNRSRLSKSLPAAGIEYVFMGDLLGGRPEGKEFYLPGGTIDYDSLAKAEFYLRGVDQLIELATARRTAIMCAEADFRNCHRYKLITRTLVSRGLGVHHILRSGEPVATTLSEFDSGELGLFG